MKISPPLSLDSQNRLVFKQGGGCISVFGLPFFAAGIFLLSSAFGFVPFENAGELKGFEYLIFFMMGLIFTAIGSALVFGRSRLVVDKKQGTVTDTFSIFVPIKQKTAQLRDFRSVVLRFEEGDSDTSDKYPVILESSADKFALSSPLNFGEARQIATSISEYLNLPFIDRTTETEAAYAPENSGFSKAETYALHKSRENLSLSRPAKMNSSVSNRNGVLEIFIPVSPAHKVIAFVFFMIFFGIVISIFSSFIGFALENSFRNMENLPVAVFFVFFVVIFFSIFRNIFAVGGNAGTLVNVTKDYLEIAENLGKRTRKRRIPAAEILSIAFTGIDTKTKEKISEQAKSAISKNPFAPEASFSVFTQIKRKIFSFLSEAVEQSNRLIIKTEKEIIPFGGGLTSDEARYLCALIKNRLHLRG